MSMFVNFTNIKKSFLIYNKGNNIIGLILLTGLNKCLGELHKNYDYVGWSIV